MARVLDHDRELIARDVARLARAARAKELLRFITCGSVDDGKSTLIGRLLYDSKQIFDDQLASAGGRQQAASGRRAQELDFALLVDGLSAEREQGITIDVAYRFFATAKRKFIVADTPGHEQYTRNMVTGASTADVAVLLVDARKGVLTQTRRHSYLAHLVGIRQLRAGGDQDGPGRLRPGRVRRDRRRLSRVRRADRDRAIGSRSRCRALNGDNVVGAQRRDALVRRAEPARASRQRCRSTPPPMPPSRCGCRCNGSTGPTRISAASPGRSRRARCAPGDEVRDPAVGPDHAVERIVTHGRRPRRGGRRPVGDADVLADEVDCSRGDVIAAAADPPEAADQFEATIVWMGEDELLPGPRLLAEARHADRDRDGPAAQI